MRQIASVVRFLPFSHDLAIAHEPYEKIYRPKENPVWIDIEKELNFKNYRCDEFIDNHLKKKHVLFSGCSVTYGSGLLLNEIWAYKVWKDLQDTSGYFNIAMEGSNISNIVFEIVKYCHAYGNPELIVVNLPDPHRSMRPIEDESMLFVFDKVITDGTELDTSTLAEIAKLELSAFQSYKILELFCKSHGIDLLSFSWSESTNSILGDKGFETFFKIDMDDLKDQVLLYAEQATDNKFFISARDPGEHFGIAYHQYFYEFINKIIRILMQKRQE
jgi:hypothetical protein